MKRRVLAVGLFASVAGLTFGLDLSNVLGRQGYYVLQSRVTIHVTTLVHENLPSRFFDLEQTLLAHLHLAPYFALLGIVCGLVLGHRLLKAAAMFPVAFTLAWVPQILHASSYFDTLRWYDMLPDAVFSLCYIPLFYLCATSAFSVRHSAEMSLRHALIAVTAILLLVPFLAFIASTALQAVILLAVLSLGAWGCSLGISKTSNKPVHPSGESYAP